jgi:hypothetical protein
MPSPPARALRPSPAGWPGRPPHGRSSGGPAGRLRRGGGEKFKRVCPIHRHAALSPRPILKPLIQFLDQAQFSKCAAFSTVPALHPVVDPKIARFECLNRVFIETTWKFLHHEIPDHRVQREFAQAVAGWTLHLDYEQYENSDREARSSYYLNRAQKRSELGFGHQLRLVFSACRLALDK